MKNFKTLVALFILAAIVFTAGCGDTQQLPKGAESLSATAFSKAELPNGLKIFSCPDSEFPITALVARVNIGAVNENPGEEGYAAVFSRLIAVDGEEKTSREMVSLGSTLKIHHEPEAMVISATVLKEDSLATATMLLKAISKKYNDAEIAAARDALVSSFSNLESSEQFQVQQLLNRTLYPESSRGAGTEKRLQALKNLTTQSFNNFLERNLMPQRILFALSGDISQELLSNFSNEAAQWQRGRDEVVAEEKSQESEETKDQEEKYTPIFVKNVRSNNSQLFMLRRLPPLNPATYYETLAVNRIFNGQSTFSRLSALQVALKLKNPIYSAVELNTRESGQIITATVPAEESFNTLSEVMKQLQILYGGKLLNSRLLGQEIADARNFLKGQLIRRTEELDALGEFVLWAENAGFEKQLPADHLAMIEAISKENLLVVIDSYFVPALNSLVAVGPERMVPQFEKNFKVEIVD